MNRNTSEIGKRLARMYYETKARYMDYILLIKCEGMLVSFDGDAQWLMDTLCSAGHTAPENFTLYEQGWRAIFVAPECAEFSIIGVALRKNYPVAVCDSVCFGRLAFMDGC